MTRRRWPPHPAAAAMAIAAAAWLVGFGAADLSARRSALPDRLSDEAFWTLSQESSEPGGYFRSADITNLTSNELLMQHVIPDLVKRVPPGRVYLGVGPEQNYTYMVATRPAMAIIFDIRRGNLDLQLMYKALFELAADRAEFVSLLFAKPRPAGLGATSTVQQLFEAFARVDTSRPLYDRTLAAIRTQLTRTHGWTLPASDLAGIQTIYETFVTSGFYVRPSPSYWDLMASTDAAGVARGYLAAEDGFQWLKALQARNLVVPVVGDFGGPRAIRAIGRYLGPQQTAVGAFYLSNVEQYLEQDGKWDAFCRNVRTLPLDGSSTFIRSQSGGFGGGRGGNFVNSLAAIADDVRACATGAR